MRDGFIKVAAATPDVLVADCAHNRQEIVEKAREMAKNGAKIIVFPELCLTGYTCQDLFWQGTLDVYKRQMQMDIWCGVGGSAEIDVLEDCLGQLQAMRDNSLTVWDKVLFLSDFRQPCVSYQNRQRAVWETLLGEQKPEALISSMRQYLTELAGRELITRDILKSFRMDITQITYSWLAAREIKAHLLFAGSENEQYYQEALESVEGAIQFASHLVTRAVEYTKYINKSESVADQLKEYIDTHYQEDIRRETLAELVYLNVDYMSRIFKKEAGI